MVIQLVQPNLALKESFLSGLQEMATESDWDSWLYTGNFETIEEVEKNFEAYIHELIIRETMAKPGLVKDSTYWAVLNQEVVGRISLRHELNDFLRKFGGHIGYIVRPSARGKGLATKMLSQLLKTQKAQEIMQLLLTCDPNNIESQKVILKNGGALEGLTECDGIHPVRQKYWIHL